MPTELDHQTFNILRADEHFVAIDKPPGYHVHQPDHFFHRVPREKTCLTMLRRQIETYLYPVHRLDVGTDGVLVFALSKPSAANLSLQFQAGSVRKTYFTLVRGWSEASGDIDLPLGLDSTGEMVQAFSSYRTHGHFELPLASGKRFSTSRYSLVEVHPRTGRYHQVRRHMARLSHPVIGDREHGDSKQNKFFREVLDLPGLWLKAKDIEFSHPVSGESVRIESTWGDRWQQLFARFSIAPPGTGSAH